MGIINKLFGRKKAPSTVDLVDEEIQDPIKKVLESRMHPDSPEIYKQSGISLKEYRGEELTNLVREYMTYSDEAVRMRASSLLSDFSKEGNKSVIPDLIRALKDNSDSVQSTAAEGLGHSGSVEAIDPIIDAVSTVYLRSYDAAQALNKIDPPKASVILRNKLANDSTDQYEWATMLVDLNDISAIPLLKKHLDRGDFDAYNKRSITQFIEDHPEINTSEEKQVCVICHTERPVIEMNGGTDQWFCSGQCWEKRGTVLPTGIGTDCPLFHEGICSAGDGDFLCSLTQGHYLTGCHVYAIQK